MGTEAFILGVVKQSDLNCHEICFTGWSENGTAEKKPNVLIWANKNASGATGPGFTGRSENGTAEKKPNGPKNGGNESGNGADVKKLGGGRSRSRSRSLNSDEEDSNEKHDTSGKGSEEDWKINLGMARFSLGKASRQKYGFLMKPKNQRTMNKMRLATTVDHRLLSTVGALTKMEKLSSVLVQKTCWGNILFLASVITFFAAYLNILIALYQMMHQIAEKYNLNIKPK